MRAKAVLIFLFLSFLSFANGDQRQFFDDVITEVNKLNDIKIPSTFGCNDDHWGNLSFGCKDGKMDQLSIINLTFTSLPSSVSFVSQSLNTLSIFNAKLTSLGSGFDSLIHLTKLNIGSNRLNIFPDSLASFSLLTFLDFHDNCLLTLPNEFSSLTSLGALHLNYNLSLQANTDLLKNMDRLSTLLLDNTLISGLKPELAPGFATQFSCANSCILDISCSKNNSCPCSVFDLNSCFSDRCDLNSQNLCVECTSLLSEKQCTGSCEWCSGEKDGIPCNWCDSKKNRCSNLANCFTCFGYSTSESCKADSSCQWCDSEYCTSKNEKCKLICSNLSDENCESESECSWCSSYLSCLDSNAQCLSCDRFTSSSCPPGCDCSSGSKSNSTVIICVVCCVVCLLICVFLFVFFKKRQQHSSHYTKLPQAPQTPLHFEEDVGKDTVSEQPIGSQYSKRSVESLFQVYPDVLSFNSSSLPLKLCSSATETFEMTNICGKKLVVESLFVKGFKEQHEFVFSPSSFTIKANEKRKISVDLMMKCSATLYPSQSLICCFLSNDQWCSLCGIQAQSELSPFLSCDDIELKREIGRGAFGKVFLGSFKGIEVAVKMYPSLTKEDNEKEANMLSKLHSPHIVTFYGISQTLNGMIIEYCKYGSVGGLLDRKEMTDEMKLLICYDCSLGMKYLHMNGIIHRDLKPDNLLVVSFSKDVNTVRAKISDFGTSRSMNQTIKMTESIGTPSFMSPEVFNNEPYGKKSDVYAFGLTVWSIFSKQTPYSELPNVQTILLKVNEGYRPQLRQDFPLNDLIKRCWPTNPSDRLSFDEITKLLKQEIEKA